MTDRAGYLAAALRLYLDLPGAPRRASRNDCAVAATLHARGVPLDTLAHAMRLAILRRTLRGPDDPPLEPVGSLAYYRRVLDTLTPEALDPGYVDYVQHKYQDLLASRASAIAPLEIPTHQDALFHRQIPAVSDRR
jgi:hypothetical protein